MPNPVTEGCRAAEAMRKQAGVNLAAPIDLTWLAEQIGLIVVRRPMPGALSGMHYSHASGRSFVAINSADIILRQNFTLAHEIGHFHFDRDQTIVEAVGDTDNSPKERRANAFAAHLLLPDAAIIAWEKSTRAVFDETDIARLALRYQLSWPATLFRLKSAGVIEDTTTYDKERVEQVHRALLGAHSEMTFEMPATVAKMADQALERHLISTKRHAEISSGLERRKE